MSFLSFACLRLEMLSSRGTLKRKARAGEIRWHGRGASLFVQPTPQPGGPGQQVAPCRPGPFCPGLGPDACDLRHTPTAKSPDRCARCGASVQVAKQLRAVNSTSRHGHEPVAVD